MELNLESIKLAALAEIQDQKLGVTQQFFAVHTMANDPVVLIEQAPDGYRVYLNLLDEWYYWVVVVGHSQQGYNAKWGLASSYSVVYLSIQSDDVSPDEISEVVGLNPTETRKIGKRLNAKSGQAHRIKENQWNFQIPKPKAATFCDKLSATLVEIDSVAERIASLASRCTIKVAGCRYEYVDQPDGFNLTNEQIQILARCRADLDVDVQIFGTPLPA